MIYMFLSVILCAIIAGMIKIKRYSIWAPGGVFALMWCGFSMFSVIFLASSYDFEYKGILWICVAVFTFLVPQMCILPIKCGVVIENKRDVPYLSWVVVICVVLGAFSSNFYSLLNLGVRLEMFLDFALWREFVHSVAVKHYAAELSHSTIEQVLNVFVYMAPLCCGYLLPYASKLWKKIVCFLCFIPPLLAMLIMSSKLAFIASILFWGISYYISFLVKNKRFVTLNNKQFVWLSGIAIVFFALIYLSFVLRVGEQMTASLNKILIEKIGVYACGHIQAFDIWFDRTRHQSLGLGIYSFRAISSKLGLASKEAGVYELMEGVCSNVYTPFRPLIEDYGIWGSLLVIYVLGIIVALSCKKILQNRNIIGQITLFFVLLSLLYFVVSPWTYTTYILAFICFSGFIVLCNCSM